jgi:PAS domain S-box-containing protein
LLKSSQESDASLIESADVVVWEAEPLPLRLVRVAGGGLDAIGHPRETWLSPEGLAPALLLSSDAASLEKLCAEVVQDGRMRRIEHSLGSARGAIGWYRTTVNVKRGGGPARVIGTTVEISADAAQSRRSGQLRDETELRLRALLNHRSLILWSVDRDGRVTFSEGKGLEVLGIQPAQLVGTSVFDFDSTNPMPWLRRALAGEPTTGEMYSPKGPSWWESCYEPLRGANGEIAGAIILSIDITGRKRVEQERDRSLDEERAARRAAESARRRSAILAQASRVLSTSFDQEATLLAMANLVVPAVADCCLVDLGAVEDARASVFVHRDPQREPELYDVSRRVDRGPGSNVAKLLAGGPPTFLPEVARSYWRKSFDEDGQYVMYDALGVRSMISVPMRARGRVVGILSFLDVATSGRLFDDEDFELAMDLAINAALAVDNARLYKEQEQAVMRRDEFLSVASHELRTPVTSLQLGVQMLLRGRERALASGVAELPVGVLEIAERQSKRLGRLVENLLDVSRISAGQLTLSLDTVDLAEVVREAAANSRDELAHAGSPLELVAPAPVVGTWDRSRLEQIVTNLLSNAIKYGEGKPVKVTVESDGVAGRLSVEDRGIGIPYDRQATIFDRFERAVSARYYSGLGLGLYIIKQIVTRLGGTIAVRSALGAGATFTVTLPLSGPPDNGAGPVARPS